VQDSPAAHGDLACKELVLEDRPHREMEEQVLLTWYGSDHGTKTWWTSTSFCVSAIISRYGVDGRYRRCPKRFARRACRSLTVRLKERRWKTLR